MTLAEGLAFEDIHMSAIKEALGGLPANIFINITKSPIDLDKYEATDLQLSALSCAVAVRVRKNKFYKRCIEKGFSLDWSIRVEVNGFRSELQKLLSGYVRWYFMAYSKDDEGTLAQWWLIDMDRVRLNGMLKRSCWPRHSNNDGTAGMYIPIDYLISQNCVATQGGDEWRLIG